MKKSAILVVAVLAAGQLVPQAQPRSPDLERVQDGGCGHHGSGDRWQGGGLHKHGVHLEECRGRAGFISAGPFGESPFGDDFDRFFNDFLRRIAG
jgi:hypothetical protein